MFKVTSADVPPTHSAVPSTLGVVPQPTSTGPHSEPVLPTLAPAAEKRKALANVGSHHGSEGIV